MAGAAWGVVVATGARAEFGRVAGGLEVAAPETAFQAGLRQFSILLVIIAATVSTSVFVVNLLLGRSPIDSLLFSAAIAVGITPQLLPAVVASSLSDGSRRLARLKVLVKRLDAIEDLGDMDVLVTDKTGTLTTGVFTLAASIGQRRSGRPRSRPGSPCSTPRSRPRSTARRAATRSMSLCGRGSRIRRASWRT